MSHEERLAWARRINGATHVRGGGLYRMAHAGKHGKPINYEPQMRWSISWRIARTNYNWR